MKTSTNQSPFPENVGQPVFLGSKWTMRVAKLPSGKIAGYVTDAISAHTTSFNDPSYSSTGNVPIPKTVKLKLHRLMRKAGWVEDVFALLKPGDIQEIIAKGDGQQVPSECADTSMARLYFVGDINHEMYVEHYLNAQHAYHLWIALPKGIRCAMRNAGETLPVYPHDLVDKF
jgi:hypothetical protein